MKEYYKVVELRGNLMRSCIAYHKYCVDYNFRMITTAPVGGLLVFRNLEDARNFVKENLNNVLGIIWIIVRGVGSEEIRLPEHRGNCSGDYEHVWNYTFKPPRIYENSNILAWPKNTVAVKYFCPVERVY